MGRADEEKPRAGDAERACVAEGECRPPHKSRKNRGHWCKGREGIPHTWEWVPGGWQFNPPSISNRAVERPVCFGCGRQGWSTRSYCRQCGEPKAFSVLRATLYRYVYRGVSRVGQSSHLYCQYCHAPEFVAAPPLAQTQPWRPRDGLIVLTD